MQASIEPGKPHISSRTGSSMLAVTRAWTISAMASVGARRMITIAVLAQLIERVSRPKPFAVEVTKGINNDFLDRRRDVAWIPRHRPQRNVASSFDHEARDFWDRERINLSPPSPLANGVGKAGPDVLRSPMKRCFHA